jgi:hypothetical protein
MVDPITQRLQQSLTPFDAANMVLHFDTKTGNALVVQLINRGEGDGVGESSLDG